MKKNSIFTIYAFLSIVALFPLFSLVAREEFHSYRGYQENSNQRPYNHPYQNYEGYNQYGYGGGYGGIVGGYNIYPYPNPESEPGMSDDTNSLYNYYQRLDRY